MSLFFLNLTNCGLKIVFFSIFGGYHHHRDPHFHNCVSKETNKLRRYLGMNEEKRLMGGGGPLLRVILMKVKVIKVMKAEGRTTNKGLVPNCPTT